MTNTLLKIKFLFFFSSFSIFSAFSFADSPLELIQKTADEVMLDIQRNKKYYEEDPARLERFIGNKVSATFHFQKMTKSVMGRYWRKANPQQQEEIMAQFKAMLIRTYASALLNYSDKKIEYLPERINQNKAVVLTRIAQSGGAGIPVNYKLYQNKAKRWWIYDVVIDGISLLTSYRGVFKKHIQRSGIDGLIKQLQTKKTS